LSVSATTEHLDRGEIHGSHYYFVDDETFDTMVSAGELLEWAVVHGVHRYGTPRRPVWRKPWPPAVPPCWRSIFRGPGRSGRRSGGFLRLPGPADRRELVRRLVGRGTESAEERSRRLRTAELEMAAEAEFDRTIVNRDVRQATDELVQCMGLVPHSTSGCRADPPGSGGTGSSAGTVVTTSAVGGCRTGDRRP
jgi:guanylate kinase